MAHAVSIIQSTQLDGINPSLKDPVEYRKSGLSLNHIIGCPLDCSYCVRHLFGNFDQRQPQALMTDEEAFRRLINHQFFQPHITPIQLFNRATDPMLPEVKPHTHNILRLLDAQGLTNHVLVITRWKVSKEDCDQFNALKHIKLSILVTYSGIEDTKIEPIKSSIAEKSLKTLFANAARYKVLLYWRPIIPGINDTDTHIEKARALSAHAHATVFSGLFYRNEIATFYRENGIAEPYVNTARRKLLPLDAEQQLLSTFNRDGSQPPIFRKTSCGVAYAHHLADYNGHYGITELCETCPHLQVARCKSAWKQPDRSHVEQLCTQLGATNSPELTARAIVVHGLDEQSRYFIQHTLGFQVHDADKPHHYGRHGRAGAARSTVDVDQQY